MAALIREKLQSLSLSISLAISLSHAMNSPVNMPSNKLVRDFVQCPYDDSACDSLDCGESAMGQRAGFWCEQWPFYSGGFGECCDENWVFSTCAHSIYNPDTESVFCDFWYETQRADLLRLDICDCKVNNGVYCESWICATSYGYDLTDSSNNSMARNEAFLEMALMPNGVEIRGVRRCGDFDDADLDARKRSIGRWCYEYDDFTSCFCQNGDDQLCLKWKCHRFLNNEKHGFPDVDSVESIHILNESQHRNLTAEEALFALSTKSSEEVYQCQSKHTVEGINLESTHCTEWGGDIETDSSFSVKECTASSPWNVDQRWTFSENFAESGEWNVSHSELLGAYPVKWECHGVGMDYRNNEQFMNFYVSTMVWSVAVGLGLLSLILCWMQARYITLSSFFCVQGWFLFIFGSIAAVHGGLASLFLYLLMQTIILIHIAYRKCQNRGKVPYGSLAQKYDFDPMEESVSRRSDDDHL